MTREEYKALYGLDPIKPSESAVDNTPAPIQMTRDEYNEKYGIKIQPQTTGFKQGFSNALEGIRTTYGGGEHGIAQKLSENIKVASEDIQRGRPTGELKAGFRTAGDVAHTIFAPIGFGIEALTGGHFSKALEEIQTNVEEGKGLVGMAVDKITDIPAIQEFVMIRPNLAEDAERFFALALSKAETGKIEPQTTLSRTKTQFSGLGEVVSNIVRTRAEQNNSVSEKLAKEIEAVENNYSKTRKANEFEKDDGQASRQRIAETDVLANATDENGLIRTKGSNGAVETYKKMTIDGRESLVRDHLVREGNSISLEQVRKGLIESVYDSTLEGADLITALRGVEREIQGLSLKADELGNVMLETLHDAKINTTKNINFNTPPETQTYRKSVARTYKTLVEESSNTPVKKLNEELSKYYKDIERLERLDGKRVKGGKLGKYASQITGNIVGGTLGATVGGHLGAASGALVGGEIASSLRGRFMSRTFGKDTGRTPKRSEILEGAKESLKQEKVVDLKTPDKAVGVPKDIPKTKEVVKLEKQIERNVKEQKKAIKAKDFELVSALKEVYKVLVDKLKEIVRTVKETPNKKGGFADFFKSSSKEGKGKEVSLLEKTEKPSFTDFTTELKTKQDLVVKDVTGFKFDIPKDTVVKMGEKGSNSVIEFGGEQYTINKGQTANLKGNSLSGEAKEFAPELAKTEETVRGSRNLEDEVTRLLDDELGEGMTRQEARDFVNQNAESEVATKYEQYTLPDGKNYREVLIKAPERAENAGYKVERVGDKYQVSNNGELQGSLYNSRTEAESGLKKLAKFDDIEYQAPFKSSHWEEPNVISHLRLNDRTYKGKKVTFMEELQSDWAREGRDKGFITSNKAEFDKFSKSLREKYNHTNPIVKATPEEVAKWNRLLESESGVPNNPLLKNWQELTVKRALKDAVDNNSEYFAWINGEQTSARYNLATQVDTVQWRQNNVTKGDGTKLIYVNAKSGRDITIRLDEKTGIIKKGQSIPNEWEGKKLDEVLGKGLADKIMSKETGTLSGEGLKFGGEWASNLYDKQVGNIVKDLTGAKIEKLDMGLPIEKKIGNNWLFEDGANVGGSVTPSTANIGDLVSSSNRQNYIIVGKTKDSFDVIPQSMVANNVDNIQTWIIDLQNPNRYAKRLAEKNNLDVNDSWVKQMVENRERFIENNKETIGANPKAKTTTQQGIKLTPEVKAIVKGEKPFKSKGVSGIEAGIALPLIFLLFSNE